ncbi:MAG: Holliday junction resolvase RuvX [OM182 bacterium]|uniref:Putative pre-16S rRNA nuclease n=1 Tax=OM182 bacterium TaxID=2510334 RepID=A0A520S754_9GAMM|nr:MAG: Holliday junction resolvase RuvX [OM182 bacterium]HBJ90853.1 Holliday junction resolvase RuvX [Gammaproteobacteria bacterium]|tara:strand:- start:176 stop:643 length:468 start_codon:yes stop_codon:yes gene_type:complete
MALESFPSRTTKPLAALSFDFGTQSIGVAFGQSISGTARPVCVLKANDGIPDWEQVGSVIAEWSPDVLVIGLPYNLDGTESELLKRAIKFGNRLNGRFHKPCYGMDERLSSRAAIEQVMEESGSMTKTSGIDDIAAQIILENWFSEFKRQVENIR